MQLSRRALVAAVAAFAVTPRTGWAATPRVIAWKDLIPPGVPYAEIIGAGEIDAAKDTWLPEFDENATKLNKELHGAYIKMLGPVEIHRVRIIVAPMWIMASKLVSVLQARIAIRLNSLSF